MMLPIFHTDGNILNQRLKNICLYGLGAFKTRLFCGERNVILVQGPMSSK